jgi:hypothetical protein
VKSLLHRRPSPALVIACIALFVSLSGVSYGVATGFIDSREIKNNSVRTKDLRNNDIRTRDLRNNEVRGVDIRNSTIQSRDIGINQVTGTDVRESTLQKVPSAAAADSATTATTANSAASAQSLNGLRVLPIKQRSGDVTNRVIFNAGGLQLLVTCSGGDEEPIARTTVANGEIAVISEDADSADGGATTRVHNLDDAFNPGENFDLRDVVTAADDRMYDIQYLGGDGASVTAHLITDDDAGASNCVVSGYAVLVP